VVMMEMTGSLVRKRERAAKNEDDEGVQWMV
jgi:hypothetical protein